MPGRFWDRSWSVRVRVWVERAGRAVLGEGRLELLEAIERTHSISAAARQLGMSYRRAWLLVQEANAAAGLPLVSAKTGGQRGGGAALTAHGRDVVAVFRRLQSEVRDGAARQLPRLLHGPTTPTLHVFAAASLEEPINQLVPAFALHQPTVRVRVVFGASDELAEQLRAGAAGDVFVSADRKPLQALRALLLPGSVQKIAENALAAIGSSQNKTRPESLADLVQGEEPIAVARPTCPLGRYTSAYLREAGAATTLRRRLVEVDSAAAVGAAVRGGLAETGFAYASDAFTATDCRVLFRCKLRSVICYAGAVLRKSPHPEEAQAFLDFLRSEAGATRFRACGFVVS